MDERHDHSFFHVAFAPSDDIAKKTILDILKFAIRAYHREAGRVIRFSGVSTTVWLVQLIGGHGHITRNKPQM